MATHAHHQQSPGAPGAAKRYQVQVYSIDDDFEESGYTNPLPTADDDEPDPQEV